MAKWLRYFVFDTTYPDYSLAPSETFELVGPGCQCSKAKKVPEAHDQSSLRPQRSGRATHAYTFSNENLVQTTLSLDNVLSLSFEHLYRVVHLVVEYYLLTSI